MKRKNNFANFIKISNENSSLLLQKRVESILNSNEIDPHLEQIVIALADD